MDTSIRLLFDFSFHFKFCSFPSKINLLPLLQDMSPFPTAGVKRNNKAALFRKPVMVGFGQETGTADH